MSFGALTQPNIIILMTDQQRNFRYFPVGWVAENLPNFTQLQQNGMTFNNNYCNACRCSPSRSVLFTGMYTAQTGVYQVGGNLPSGFTTLAQVMGDAGYEMVYKGKWHLTSAFNGPSNMRPVTQSTANQYNTQISTDYGMENWNFPDAGDAEVTSPPVISVPATGSNPVSSGFFTLGGNEVDNDSRFVTGEPYTIEGEESAIDFLNNYQNNGSTNPFCMVVSLVNPHDVSVFPNAVNDMEYINDQSIWQAYSGFAVPSTYSESLADRPQQQLNFLQTFDGGPIATEAQAVEYMQFYAYLHTLPDALFTELMNNMSQDLINNTIIVRLADHGEMGMSHGGLRMKDYNAYNETINVPLVFSNPILFPSAVSVEQLISLVDMVPTLGAIAGLTQEQIDAYNFKGNNYSQVLLDETTPTKPNVLFTYDDTQGVTTFPCRIRSLIKSDYKLNVYYKLLSDENPSNPATVDPNSFQYELYDLRKHSDESVNMLPLGKPWDTGAQDLLNKHYSELTDLMEKNHTDTKPTGWPSTPPAETVFQFKLEKAQG